MELSRHIKATYFIMMFVNVTCGFTTSCKPTEFEMCRDAHVPPYVQHFTIVSEHYHRGGQYDTDTNCHLLLDTQPHPVILVLQFEEFDVEYDEDCRFDNLEIAGQTFCGKWLRGKVLKFLVHPFKITEFHFFSDYSVSGRGFSINVDIIPYLEGESVSEYSGPGSRFSGNFSQSVYVRNDAETPQADTQEMSAYRKGLLGFLNHFYTTPKDETNVNDDSKLDLDREAAHDRFREMLDILRDKDGYRWFDIRQEK